MGPGASDRLLKALEGEFEAAVRGEDEASARDLAFSLAQDVPVTADILRDGACVVVGDVVAPVDRVGHDFLEAGRWLVPLERAVLFLGSEERPVRIAQVFLGALRAAARRSARVAVGVAGGLERSGLLVRANPTHVVLESRSRIAVPLQEIAYVRRVPGGSADAL